MQYLRPCLAKAFKPSEFLIMTKLLNNGRDFFLTFKFVALEILETIYSSSRLYSAASGRS